MENNIRDYQAVLMLVLLFAGCTGTDSPYLNMDAAYVGIDVCASCHPDKAATYERSQMGRSWEVATLENSAADFNNPAPVYDELNNLYYQAFAREDSLFIMEYRLDGSDTVHSRIERIDYIVGSGHHTNSHIMNVRGYLYQMPMTWYVQDGKWDLAPGFKDGNNARFDRPIVTKCITCHNGMPEIVAGSYNKYDNVPHGIGCERCHGPGTVHVEAMRAGKAVNVAEEIDYTIVNPAKLPVALQFNICQGCHVQGAAVPKEGKSFADFRPGMSLASVENVFWPRFADSLRQFVMASHADRLTQSECFRQAPVAEPLTCVTCHDPHVPIETLGREQYDAACQNCHAPASVEVLHAEPVTESCVACHMPVSGPKDIPHVRITDHFIRTPDTTSTILLSKEPEDAAFVRMASLIDPSPTDAEIASGYLTYYEEVTNYPGFLDSAATYLSAAQARTSLSAVAAPLIRLHFLNGDYRAITLIARDLDSVLDAWTAYRIGEAYLKIESPGTAIPYLEQAVQMAPARLDFKRRLATGYVLSGSKIHQAETLLSEVLTAHPKFAEAYSDRGYVWVLLRDMEQAEADLQAAIALSPDLEPAIANLASLYFNLGRKQEARPLVQRLLDLNETNIQYHQLWTLVQ